MGSEFKFQEPAKTQDSPDKSIRVEGIHIDTMSWGVRLVVRYTPILSSGVLCPPEKRMKIFTLTTPFIDMLEDIPNLYGSDWRTVAGMAGDFTP